MQKFSSKKVQKSDQKNDLFFQNLQKFSQLLVITKVAGKCSPKNSPVLRFQRFCKNKKNRLFSTRFFKKLGFATLFGQFLKKMTKKKSQKKSALLTQSNGACFWKSCVFKMLQLFHFFKN